MLTAAADDLTLPIIDLRSDRFTVPDGEAAIAALRSSYLDGEKQRRRIPKPLMALFIRLAARRAPLLRSVARPEGSFLGGLATYVMKLGADQLVPPYDNKVDRRLAASPMATSMRIRLQQIARLAAESLGTELAGHPGAPLHVINIGGGSAIDSINALLLLHDAAPELLARQTCIHVFDVDEKGPAFGANILAALTTSGAFGTAHLTLAHRRYDWSDPAPLVELTRTLTAGGAVLVAMSEGALFEYGSDEVVVANLTALHGETHGARFIAGSVTRADELTRRASSQTRFCLVPRGAEGLAALAQSSGYRLARVESALISDQVLLERI